MKELLKNIEYKIKSATKGITTENRGELTFLKTIIDEYNIKKVLFLRQDRIGDLLISSPLFRILKEKYPDIEFDILLSNYNTSAYELVKNYFSNAIDYAHTTAYKVSTLNEKINNGSLNLTSQNHTPILESGFI